MTINAIGNVSQVNFKGAEPPQEAKMQLPQAQPDTFEKQSDGTDKKPKSKIPIVIGLAALAVAVGVGIGIKKGKIQNPFKKKDIEKAGDEVKEELSDAAKEIESKVKGNKDFSGTLKGKKGDNIVEFAYKNGKIESSLVKDKDGKEILSKTFETLEDGSKKITTKKGDTTSVIKKVMKDGKLAEIQTLDDAGKVIEGKTKTFEYFTDGDKKGLLKEFVNLENGQKTSLEYKKISNGDNIKTVIRKIKTEYSNGTAKLVNYFHNPQQSDLKFGDAYANKKVLYLKNGIAEKATHYNGDNKLAEQVFSDGSSLITNYNADGTETVWQLKNTTLENGTKAIIASTKDGVPTAQLELLDYGTIEAFKLDEKGVVIPGAISWHKDTNRQVILHDFATDMFALKKSDK